jgi:hypothetical protein
VLHPGSRPSALALAIAEAKARVRAVGLIDAEIDAELEAYYAETPWRPGRRLIVFDVSPIVGAALKVNSGLELRA